MPFQSDTRFSGWHIQMTSVGTLASIKEVEGYIHFLRKEAQKHRTQKVLLDERNLMDEQDTCDAYKVCESESTAKAALAGIRLSCVCHPNNFELNKTYETLLLNRSLIFKVFLNEGEALLWLKG